MNKLFPEIEILLTHKERCSLPLKIKRIQRYTSFPRYAIFLSSILAQKIPWIEELAGYSTWNHNRVHQN